MIVQSIQMEIKTNTEVKKKTHTQKTKKRAIEEQNTQDHSNRLCLNVWYPQGEYLIKIVYVAFKRNSLVKKKKK